MFRRTLQAASAAALLAVTASPAFAQTSAPAKVTVALTPPPPASTGIVDVAAWRTAYVDESHAVPIGASDKGVEYGVPGSFSITPEGTVKGWMRWEQFGPTRAGEDDTRSFTQLIEVDCRGGRGRLLALDLYPYNNLQGSPRHVDAQAAEWAYSRPGSVLEQNISLMCSTAKAALTTAIAQAAQAQGSAGPSSSLAALRAPQ